MVLEVPVSPGEVIDRITILAIKAQRLASAAAREAAADHMGRLEARWRAAGLERPPQQAELRRVNEALWQVEDDLRAAEAQGRFDRAFIDLARSVYKLNDRRAALKRAIDQDLGGELSEAKQHPSY